MTNPKSVPTLSDPIRWDAPDAGVWSLETAHSTTATAVPMREIMERGFADGFRTSFAELGVPLSHVELRHLNGWPYVSFFVHDVPRSAGKPPPAFVLKILTRVHPGFRRRTKVASAAIEQKRALQMSADWEEERQTWIDRILDLQRTDLTQLDDSELAAHMSTVTALAADGLRRHFELVAGCIPLGEWLARTAEWKLPDDAARRAVMHSTPVHEEARVRLERIAAALDGARPTDLDGVRGHSAAAAEALDDYLTHHGWWSTEDAIDADRLIDHPDIVLKTILAEHSAPDDGAAALADLRAQIPADQRDDFDGLAADAHRAHKMLDDNSGILASWIGGVAGEVFREAGRRLVRTTRLRTAADVWAFTPTDLAAMLDGSSALSDDDIGAVVAKWHMECALAPPAHLNGEPTPPPDAGVFPAPVARLMTAIGAFLDDKFNDQHEANGIGTRNVTGRAVVTRSPSDAFERLEPGDILVTTATTPSYNAVLPMVGGLVVSEGGPSCHAAIVARELDLPTIVGLQDALTTIPDGATITLDPVHARVTVVTTN